MGGKALKHLGVKRLQLADYEVLKSRVLQILNEYYRLIAMPAVLHSKESFGDLDVLVSGARGTRDPTLDPRFNSAGRIVTGNVTSFEVDSFQVDLIWVPEHSFNLARFYFCADVGAILGVLVAKVGLQLGHCGFFIRYVSHKGEHRPFLLSTDLEQICDYLHLDARQPLDVGFASQEALCEFCTHCRFDVRLMKSGRENKSHRHNMARPVFAAFLDFIDLLPGTAALVNVEAVHKEAASAFGRTAAFAAFKNQINRSDRLKAVLSKQTVGPIVGMEGKELGRLRRAFQAAHAPEHILTMHADATLEGELLAFRDLREWQMSDGHE